mmetsp:Transcript_2433/g.4801  ORF Transcript_2433/g.4801 Transcript_2433/m.4801 type:complete len:228 (+) Transcript_2433:318-1001(+)
MQQRPKPRPRPRSHHHGGGARRLQPRPPAHWERLRSPLLHLARWERLRHRARVQELHPIRQQQVPASKLALSRRPRWPLRAPSSPPWLPRAPKRHPWLPRAPSSCPRTLRLVPRTQAGTLRRMKRARITTPSLQHLTTLRQLPVRARSWRRWMLGRRQPAPEMCRRSPQLLPSRALQPRLSCQARQPSGQCLSRRHHQKQWTSRISSQALSLKPKLRVRRPSRASGL